MVEWYKNEENFYAMTTTTDSNVEETTFESGKSRYTLKNSSPKKVHRCSFLLKNRDDEMNFWTWYEYELLSRTQTVQLRNLVNQVTMTEYRMIEEPQIQDSQYPKECQVSFREE